MQERKRKILRAVTDDYIQTAEPVGSRTIARKYNLGVSPATIRNEMADLEEGGYLRQPHTSAGRIPSDKGYRYYVDSLMDVPDVPPDERVQIQREIYQPQRELGDVIQRAIRLLTMLTNYTSLAVMPGVRQGAVRHIQILPMDETHVLVLLVTEPGFVQHCIVEVSNPLTPSKTEHLSSVLNDHLRGRALGDLDRHLLSQLGEDLNDLRLFEQAVELLHTAMQEQTEEAVYLDGAVRILNQPEFRDVERAKLLMEALEERGRILSMLTAAAYDQEVTITIGEENVYAGMKDCSMVTATYGIGGQTIGLVGVLGPTRMEYARAVSVVEFVADNLSEMLTKMSRRWSRGR
ncbi:MAG: heat-inducible transcriptional repressor HrcA [Limnochordia bacterium]|jgi:heat-inducible transcriptional repressor